MSDAKRLFRSVVLFGVAAGAAAAVEVGCFDNQDIAIMCAGCNDVHDAAAVPSNPTNPAAIDAATVRGNPLCHVANSACMPDDDRDHHTAGTSECAPAGDAGHAGDGGDGRDAADEGDAGDAAPTTDHDACRISRKDSTIGTACVGSTPAAGDGATCTTGSDCAPGFDCIAGENAAKACRHYCCAGTCKGHPSQDNGATFCDVEPLVDVNQKAPVCIPLRPCKLLGTGECTATESCSLVGDDGETGCVTVGARQAGASCDEDHCAASLACLGSWGARKCYKLCKVGSADCGASQVCKTSFLFKDPSFGSCQPP